MNNTIKSAFTSTAASLTIAGVFALADKAIKEYDEAKLRSRNGYKRVHVSSLMTGGIKPGQFCVSGDELMVGFIPGDMKSNVSASSFQIAASIPYHSEENAGWYFVRIDGATRISFFDGENILVVPSAKDYAFIKKELNVGADLIRGDIEDLTGKVKKLEKAAKELNDRLMKAEKAATHKADMKAKKPEKKEYDETKDNDENLV